MSIKRILLSETFGGLVLFLSAVIAMLWVNSSFSESHQRLIESHLFFGKQLGVFGVTWLLVKVGWATKPGQCRWQSLYGVSLLCGIGFTMSLFLGTLSFQGDSAQLIDVRLGVLIGSILSALAGGLVLYNSRTG